MASSLIVAAVLFFCVAALGNDDNPSSTDTYIVYLGGRNGFHPEALTESHHQILTEVLGSTEKAVESMRYSYKHTFSGFSAEMTADQARAIAGKPGVVNVFRSKNLILHTTRSWDFVGLPIPNNEQLSKGSSDVIIGVLDTGIWPESKSFNDSGMGPVPAKWKGQCVNGAGTNTSTQVQCNRKIIGARYYDAGITDKMYLSGRDEIGHGSHTASTAGGTVVPGVSINGLAKGTARGGLSNARIAVYKVCWMFKKCTDDGMLAAIDDAVNDGVDVLSISLGAEEPQTYDHDSVAIGSFHAAQHGVSVSASAGNSGPGYGSILNGAPWLISAAASTTDRNIGVARLNQQQDTTFGKPAPVIPYFSSRGPNKMDPYVLKPDVAAPGVQILAATIPSDMDSNGQQYKFQSGTSMACPHVTGTIAYVKSVHPEWSPAVIKSAIMTTANQIDNTNMTITTDDGQPGTPFDFGAGEIQPGRAIDPGLVYEIEPSDYVVYLCNAGFTTTQLRTMSGNANSTCPAERHAFPTLNYPSFSFPQLGNGSQKAQRTVTNVGPAQSTYRATVRTDPEVSVSVNPTTLKFTAAGQKLSYELTMTSKAKNSSEPSSGWSFAWLNWSDGKRNVRSTIAVRIA